MWDIASTMSALDEEAHLSWALVRVFLVSLAEEALSVYAVGVIHPVDVGVSSCVHLLSYFCSCCVYRRIVA